MVPAALVALIGWTLFAFAGAYRWTVWPALLVTGGLLTIARPRLLAARTRMLDAALLSVLAALGLQVVPLPVSWRDAISPAAARLDASLRLAAPTAFSTLSIDPAASAWSLTLAAFAMAVFWIARTQFERGGLRRVGRGLAWIGGLLALTVFVQRYGSPHHIYGFWTPITRSANPSPFGPYVNRNDLATWLLLAMPVVLGYSIGRTIGQLRGRRWASALEHLLDPRALLLTGSLVVMVATLVASLSRSGITGAVVALAAIAAIGHRRLDGQGARTLAASLVILLLLATPFTNLAAMAFRFGEVLPADLGSRLAIWRESWRMACDFALTGLGAGAFARGMLVYQSAPRLLFFNHAHNEYLQWLAEGGLLVCVPAAAAVAALLVTCARQLRHDVAPVFWFRLGALAGLLAVAVQSVWDTGLRMPANTILFAVVAAIAVHRSPHRPGADGGALTRTPRETAPGGPAGASATRR